MTHTHALEAGHFDLAAWSKQLTLSSYEASEELRRRFSKTLELSFSQRQTAK